MCSDPSQYGYSLENKMISSPTGAAAAAEVDEDYRYSVTNKDGEAFMLAYDILREKYAFLAALTGAQKDDGECMLNRLRSILSELETLLDTEPKEYSDTLRGKTARINAEGGVYAIQVNWS